MLESRGRRGATPPRPWRQRKGRTMKTSLGIWALGPMVTRFNPNGNKPDVANERPVERVRRAVEGLGDLIDGYEFHYPRS